MKSLEYGEHVRVGAAPQPDPQLPAHSSVINFSRYTQTPPIPSKTDAPPTDAHATTLLTSYERLYPSPRPDPTRAGGQMEVATLVPLRPDRLEEDLVGLHLTHHPHTGALLGERIVVGDGLLHGPVGELRSARGSIGLKGWTWHTPALRPRLSDGT